MSKMVMLFSILFSASLYAAVPVITGSQAKSDIVVSGTASKQVKDAAALLAQYLQKSTGVSVEIKDSALGTLNHIHVGANSYVNGRNLHVDTLDGDGFVIAFPDAKNIVIIGPTDFGTEYGVYEFLERYLGVRWLLPGSDGEHVPHKDTVTISVEEIREEPAFFSRNFSGIYGEGGLWAKRNRRHSRINFHHHLNAIFPVSKYGNTHPEFYPLLSGERYIPSSDADKSNWQPCFTAPGSVEEAVSNINAYFDANPAVSSYSLGVNDRLGYCECDNCKAKNGTNTNYLGLPDYSPSYYSWANAIVTGVLKTHPDKWFGCLAYNNVASPPPGVKLHERFIPFMTYDRMKWIKPADESQGHQLTENWQASANSLAWYDYVYGGQYTIPRVYFHQMQDYLSYGLNHGVKAMYAEAYPGWGEGPKLYVMTKLWWNPNRNTDSLLNDWYRCAVGQDAAEDLAEYYKIWEDFWTKTIPASSWWGNGQYLPFKSPNYVKLVTEDDLTRSRSFLESALAKTSTAPERTRADLLLNTFEFYEASGWYGLLCQRIDKARHWTRAEIMNILADAAKASDNLNTLTKLNAQYEITDPIMDSRNNKYPPPAEWHGNVCSYTIDPLWAKDATVRRTLEYHASGKDSTLIWQTAREILSIANGDTSVVSINPSFEDSTAPWIFGIGTTGSMKRDSTKAKDGKFSVLCHGGTSGSVSQSFAVDTGTYFASGYFFIPTAPRANARLILSASLKDSAGNQLALASNVVYPDTSVYKKWQRMRVKFSGNPINGKKVKTVTLVLLVTDFQTSDIYLDDIRAFKARYNLSLTRGCMDTTYLKYNPLPNVHVQDSCGSKIIKGCMDTNSTMFDSLANVHDSLMCRIVGVQQTNIWEGLKINPHSKILFVSFSAPYEVSIYDLSGIRRFTARGQGSRVYSLTTIKGRGVYLLKWKWGKKVKQRKIYLE
ncbi:MAG: DUF4838 domain-containing protein [Fibrobacteria bacterium]|nr:DUF4838 domain-containing protein [Fibrobacteria bacterium]